MPTIHNLAPEKLAVYRAAAQRRREQQQSELDDRRAQAWIAARQAARLLKAQFKATRVVLFGSLARGAGFTRWSDVDIAAWGIASEDTFRAIGAILDMDTEVAINLVDVNTCQPSLLAVIEQDGFDL
ncbi:MAG: nucleotidyltransferase domain-containing protein [Anaerolineae bacterium]|nr:nucleotidyltransferase domain-containing protein [Anaerolineae bacterium]